MPEKCRWYQNDRTSELQSSLFVPSSHGSLKKERANSFGQGGGHVFSDGNLKEQSAPKKARRGQESSQHFGVRFRPDLHKWVAEIRVAEWKSVDKKVWLGTFDSELGAARAVDVARRLLQCKKRRPPNCPCLKLDAYAETLPSHLNLNHLENVAMFKEVTLFIKRKSQEYAASFRPSSAPPPAPTHALDSHAQISLPASSPQPSCESASTSSSFNSDHDEEEERPDWGPCHHSGSESLFENYPDFVEIQGEHSAAEYCETGNDQDSVSSQSALDQLHSIVLDGYWDDQSLLLDNPSLLPDNPSLLPDNPSLLLDNPSLLDDIWPGSGKKTPNDDRAIGGEEYASTIFLSVDEISYDNYSIFGDLSSPNQHPELSKQGGVGCSHFCSLPKAQHNAHQLLA